MSGEHEKSAEVGVAVLVKNGDRVLLEKRANSHGAGTWGPPSGYIRYGEKPEATGIRETMEETGVTISEPVFRCMTNDVFEGEQKHYITLWFDAKYVSGEATVKAPQEESEVGWFTWDALPQPLFLPLQHLLEGKTYPSQTTEQKLGAAIEDGQTEVIHPSRLP